MRTHKFVIKFIVCSGVSLVILILFFGSCIPVEKKSVGYLDIALNESGENRTELEKVLGRYNNVGDSLKYRAACFLIENMVGYSYREGKILDNYLEYYKLWSQNRQLDSSVFVDSITRLYGNLPISLLPLKYDIQEIDSAYLCHNIDWAFKVWREQPWGKNVSFDDFCEYILPYRIGDEKLDYWREDYYNQYNLLLDSLRLSTGTDKEDPVVAAQCLMKFLTAQEVTFSQKVPAILPHIGPKVVKYLCGTCREYVDYVLYTCRALGIPCAIDAVPALGNNNGRHFWVAFWDKDGEPYLQDFPYMPQMVRKDWMRWSPKAKVYRTTFSVNREIEKQIASLEEEIYPFWENPRFIDVTFPYAYYYKDKLHIPSSMLYSSKIHSRIAYLCVNWLFDWIPVDWTVYDPDNLVFHQIQKGCIMRVAVYEDDKLYCLTDPFYMDELTNEFHVFSGEDVPQDITLYSKFSLAADDFFRDRMLRGVFEGSNRADFLEKDTLFIINERPYRLQTVVFPYDKSKGYRYVRYWGNDGTNCNVAEVSFYSAGDTIPLSGKVIGTPGCFQGDGSHEYTNVFDGKTWTSFDYKETNGGWAGLDLGKVCQISKIVYTPRNWDNYIRPGDDFELFYCQQGWKSAGRVTALSDSLVWRELPSDALFLLVNHTRGVQQRIFTYEKGEQIWR